MSKESSWPVILHQTLEKTEYGRLIKQKTTKLRYSISGSVIFPMSGLAFLILHLKDCVTQAGSTELKTSVIESIDKFIQVHRRSYLLAVASRHMEFEQTLFHDLQHRYIQTNLQMMPVHNATECVQSMMSIAKLLCKPTCELMTARFESVLAQTVSSDSTASALAKFGVSGHEIQYIQDGIGNLSQLARASREDLLNCSLDTATVDRILHIFNTSSS